MIGSTVTTHCTITIMRSTYATHERYDEQIMYKRVVVVVVTAAVTPIEIDRRTWRSNEIFYAIQQAATNL